MDGVSAASSVLAVIDLSAKIALLLFRYSQGVKTAKSDIKRLQEELERLNATLDGLRKLLDHPNGSKLQTLRQLHEDVNGCSDQLTDILAKLKKKLDSDSTRLMRRFGIRALKWPFESHEVDFIMARLEKHRNTLAVALAIDHAEQTLDLSQTITLSKLPIATGATFDSHAEEHYSRCHPETRVALLQNILDWVGDPQGRCVFWLNGMAGTGKSTISRTVAQSFAENGILGASFFFKRGEQNRGNADRLFTTISSQLVTNEPSLAPSIAAAMKADPTLTSKSLTEQFRELVVKPLDALKPRSHEVRTLAFVIDALDETFLTSRPELPIRMGFNTIHGSYQDLVLHEIPQSIIKHDISAFLHTELATIRAHHNSLSPYECLPCEWPSQEEIQELAQMATPLFIFAATVCRFIKDPTWSDPKGQLAKVLQYRPTDPRHEIDSLDATYRPVLDQLVATSQIAQLSLVNEFRGIVASIILLTEPLSASSLSRILDIPRSDVDRRLRTLHSVLSVPASPEAPIRMLHLSFRDFLINTEKSKTNPFWIDERATHAKLTSCCIKLLSAEGNLKEDICDLKSPGAARTDLPTAVVSLKLPADVPYACQYWVYHAVESGDILTDNGEVYWFFKCHLLHWLEALSLVGKISESVGIIRDLQSLPIYSSALIFAPKRSKIRAMFEENIPLWITKLPAIEMDWSNCEERQQLKSLFSDFSRISYSQDGKTLTSFSRNGTVQVWDIQTGHVRQALDFDQNNYNKNSISPSGSLVVSFGGGQKPAPGHVLYGNDLSSMEKQILKGHTDWIFDVAFAPDGNILASISVDGTLRLWDVFTGKEMLSDTLSGGFLRENIVFAPDGRLLATVTGSRIVKLLDTKTLEERQKFFVGSIYDPIVFSADGKMLGFRFSLNQIRVIRIPFDGEKEVVQNSDESSHGMMEMAGQLWNPASGNATWTPRFGVPLWIHAFSPDGSEVASIISKPRGSIQFWDVATGEKKNEIWDIDLEGEWASPGYRTARHWPQPHHRSDFFGAVAFSPDGGVLASSTRDELWVWDTTTEVSPDENSIALVYHSDHSSEALVLVLNLERMSMSPLHWFCAEFTTVSFSEDGRYLKFNSGHFLDLDSECFSPEKGFFLQSPSDGIFDAGADLLDHNCHHCVAISDQTGLLLYNDWVYKDGIRILWVPPDYRSRLHGVVQLKDTIALGDEETSEITFIQFDFSVLS
ncbi:Vegetative incompatibility protein HET-E-1 [Penicillium canariense]|uniref:Vegetative incompatibility protein HET-E-1 n=1 Tax=Penicillium canariense TaxID=189055 RepID=A0A9W9IG32_9EURO|nr:Vegetative incompatibility protein HET-E-1 [Penicillium canariense]KAJ5175634.1 Vegetative incompatibility protein HET-E-1 [Penicillium canariense]